jgi:hypothetical protein
MRVARIQLCLFMTTEQDAAHEATKNILTQIPPELDSIFCLDENTIQGSLIQFTYLQNTRLSPRITALK